MAPPGRSSGFDQSSFAAALINALEEAQAAAAQPKPPAQLAQAAWSKLQFDFPVVTAEELGALVQEYASGARSEVSARFLGVLRESAAAAPAAAASELTESAAGGSSSSSSSRGSAAGASASKDAASPSPAAPGAAAASTHKGGQLLVPLYQQLYAVAVLQSLRACLEASEAAAEHRLAGLRPEGGAAGPCGSVLEVEGASQLEEALAAAAAGQAGEPPAAIDLKNRMSQQEDDDSTAYEPLELPAQQQQQPPIALQQQQQQQQHASPHGSAAAGAGEAAGAGAGGLPGQLAQLADHLSYHSMSDPAAWRELALMQRLADCLAAARRHPRFADLAATVQPLLRLAADRLAAHPMELEAGLPVLLDALEIPGGVSTSSGGSGAATAAAANGARASSKQDAAAAAVAADLALSVAVALATQVSSPSARRWLWAGVNARLLPVAAHQLEDQQVALARAARAASAAGGSSSSTGAGGTAVAATGEVQVPAEQLYRIMLPCQLLYFYVLEAPRTGGPSAAAGGQLQEAFLKAGLLRSLVLLFAQLANSPGTEPLCCALLLACGAAQPLADWAAAVPGFAAAVAGPELAAGGEAALHGALWRLLLGGAGGELAALLEDATPADKVPGVYQALQLMADLQTVSRRPAPLWGPEVEASLRALAGTLRQHYSRQRQEAEAEAAVAAAPAGEAAAAAAAAGEQEEEQGQGDRGGAEEEEDEKKLGRPAEEQAAVLAARRAAQLQPACLKLIKDLLQRRAGGGKHD